MKVRFYTSFSKRNNSTKQISSEAYTELELVLKEATSIENPSFLISGDHFDYTYAYIADWNRYYFVDQVLSSAKGLTQITLKEDYLASWKTDIGNTVAHIVYSSTGYDRMIVDSRMAVKSSKQITADTLAVKTGSNQNVFDSTGCFILSVVNTKGSGNGFACSYVVDYTTLQALAGFLMALDFTDPTQQLIKSIWKPFDCIISCTWLPVALGVAGTQGTPASIFLGDYNTEIGGTLLGTVPRITNTQNITVTPRYNDFRSIQPYTSYSLFIPMYGLVDLNASDLQMASVGGLPITWSLDIASGDFVVQIYQGSAKLQTFNFNIGVNCPIAQTSTNMTGTIASIGGTIGGIIAAAGLGASGNIPGAIAAGVGVLGGAASTVLNANTRATSIKGGINGRAMQALGGSFALCEFATDTEDPDNANYIARWGRPVGLTHAISNHSGYVQCENASVSINGLESEREAINSYLNSGFYYE